jgi:hypothetical protein
MMRKNSMKMKHLFALCGIVAALFCVSSVSAQDNNGGGGNGGGGGGGRGYGGGRGGNFDPAQFQQRMMDGVRDQLGFTNDTDWDAVQPLVQKVMDARRDVGAGNNMRMMFRRNRDQNGGDNNRQRNNPFFGTPSPESQALQNAIDNNAPDGQIKDLLARYETSQKAKQDKLKAAQDNLRAVLTVKQEATATLLGLLE